MIIRIECHRFHLYLVKRLYSIFTLFIAVLCLNIIGCDNKVNNKTAEHYFRSPDMLELIGALETNNTPLIKSLLENDVDINHVGVDNITPLFWFLMTDDESAVATTLKYGGDPNMFSYKGHTAVTYASAFNSLSLLTKILESGGDSDSASNDAFAKTALMWSITNNRHENLMELVRKGANINKYDKYGSYNPLTEALKVGGYKQALVLLKLGADPTCEDAQGYTFAHEYTWPSAIAGKGVLDVEEELRKRNVTLPLPYPPIVPKEYESKSSEVFKARLLEYQQNKDIYDKIIPYYYGKKMPPYKLPTVPVEPRNYHKMKKSHHDQTQEYHDYVKGLEEYSFGIREFVRNVKQQRINGEEKTWAGTGIVYCSEDNSDKYYIKVRK